jgi:hypothetical protein
MRLNGIYLKKLLLLVFINLLFNLFVVQNIYAQNPVIEEIVEELASNSENEDLDYSDIIDDLNYYLENPLNLNDANIESLEKLHFLSEFQIENLLEYLTTKGPMKTIFELQLIEGFEIETINKLILFVKVADPGVKEKDKLKDIFKYSNQKISAQTGFILQDQSGYFPENVDDSLQNRPAKYQGNNMKQSFRYRINYKTKFYAGITTEKDPGEKLGFESNKLGFDFSSFHFQANDMGRFKTIIVGDYQARFGQGLIFSTGFGLGKSPNAINIRKTGQGLRYYSSTDENNFLRGFATTLKFGKAEATFFISHKKIDASLTEADTIGQTDESISSLTNTGYHRTESEMQNRKLIKENIFGTSLAFGFERSKIGINFITYQFDLPINESAKPYKLYDFSGNINFNASVDYSVFARKFYFFGEAAVSKNGAIAVLNGMVTKIASQISFSFLHRYYQVDYQANYAGSFGENTKVSNEQGLYYGLIFYPVRKLRISAYADAFKFPWLKYGVDAPSHGTEYLINTDYTINRNISMYFRWRCETKQDNVSQAGENFNTVINQNRQNFRFHISYRVSQNIGFRSRLEKVIFSKDDINESGYMILQDINFDFNKIPLSFDIRYCLFDASYNTRIYAYENDLQYNFSIPSYSGKGSRFYVTAKYNLKRKIIFGIRYGNFIYSDRNVIGSGYDEIEGNKKSEIKLQLIWTI